MLFNISQLHGYPIRSKPSEETAKANTSSNCNFAEEISKLCKNLIRNFHDLRDEILSMLKTLLKKTSGRERSTEESYCILATQNNNSDNSDEYY